jgi:hypothetical protein
MAEPQAFGSCSTGRRTDEECVFILRYTDAQGLRGWFCTKHQQWHYVFPIAIEYHYFDGTTAKFDIKVKS